MHTNTSKFDQAAIYFDEQDPENIGLAIRWYGDDGSQESEPFDDRDMDDMRAFIAAGGDVTIKYRDGRDYYFGADDDFTDLCILAGWVR